MSLARFYIVVVMQLKWEVPLPSSISLKHAEGVKLKLHAFITCAIDKRQEELLHPLVTLQPRRDSPAMCRL
jgi:hypothetical protein